MKSLRCVSSHLDGFGDGGDTRRADDDDAMTQQGYVKGLIYQAVIIESRDSKSISVTDRLPAR